MSYTVKSLAKISGVSVRTLHFYDDIKLLLPHHVGENGYRYYQEEELLRLQQILFFKELGLELKDIKSIIDKPDFDKVATLLSHKEFLLKKADKTKELILNIDQTVKRLNGDKTMNDKELFRGLSKEEQEQHEKYLINRYGDNAKKHIDESKKKTSTWNQDQWNEAANMWDAILKDLAQLLAKNQPVDAPEVQAVLKRHFEFIKQTWTPDYHSYIGMCESYVGSEWAKAFLAHDPNHPRLAQFLADAAKVFAKDNLK